MVAKRPSDKGKVWECAARAVFGVRFGLSRSLNTVNRKLKTPGSRLVSWIPCGFTARSAMSLATLKARLLYLALASALLLGIFAIFSHLFGSPQPLKKLTHNGETFFTTNPDFVRSLSRAGSSPAMPPVWVAAQKPEGVRRVVLLGGSTAAGLPMVDYHLGRIIEARWRARFPGERIEVINLSMGGADSATLREFARSAMKLEPDMIVVCAQGAVNSDNEADFRDIVRRALSANDKILFLLPPFVRAGKQNDENDLRSLQRTIASESGPAAAVVDADQWMHGQSAAIPSDALFLDDTHLNFAGRVALAELAVDGMAALWGIAPRDESPEAVAAWWQKFPQAESEARRDTFFTAFDDHDMWSLAMKLTTDPGRRAQLAEKVGELRRRAAIGWDTTDLVIAYERAQLQNPRDPLTHFTAGRLLGLRGEGERAEEAFQRGFALQPNNPEARLNYAAMQMTRGDTAAARASLENLEKYDPEAEGLLKMQAAVALREAELPHAAELLQTHLSRDPDDTESWLTLSEVQLKLGDSAASEASRRKGER